jgi:nitrite transporter NirC
MMVASELTIPVVQGSLITAATADLTAEGPPLPDEFDVAAAVGGQVILDGDRRFNVVNYCIGAPQVKPGPSSATRVDPAANGPNEATCQRPIIIDVPLRSQPGGRVPIPISSALDEAGQLAAGKARSVRDLPRYLASAMLAGAYVGVAVVLLAAAAGPLYAASSPMTKLVQGAVFGVALTLVVFAGAELFTSNTMTMIQGLALGMVRGRELAAVWAASLIGNLAGAVAFAAMVNAGGTLHGAPGEKLVASMVAAKSAATGTQLFWRAVLCNLLVCLAIWMAARTKSDAAKAIVLWWALLAFITSGFEHSIANMTLFSLAVFQGHATWADLAQNLVWTVPGNIVGGAVLVGALYWWIGSPTAEPRTR